MSNINSTYLQRRNEIQTYFDRTAAAAWERLTSNAPLGRIRASVRAGRDQMRETLLSWLPENMSGMRLLDAGCGTGALSICALQRGAQVIAIDLSSNLIRVARQRHAEDPPSSPAGSGGFLEFYAGDMLDPAMGEFDYVVAMDSLIHYDANDMVNAINGLAKRTRKAVLFTFPPRTPLLAFAHSLGRIFPRSDRSPQLAPVAQTKLQHLMDESLFNAGWQSARSQKIQSGFYTSQAWELKRIGAK
jgi:magnesium-protoporphyrin O-methyltransferase